ncbi:MAG: hypothetical protein HY351_01410 [Candidatus Omnitrophica bacterium]|nr:hypothetical protein [Candidatus Omnitrophota bacterium]
MRARLKLMAIGMVLMIGVIFGTPFLAYGFHINPQADTLSDTEAKAYVGGSIGGVTGALESPSMVRDNLSDTSKIDYIYIGNNQVYTFEVLKAEGKEVTGYQKHSRSTWESGVYPSYPPKNA